jgi:hypothetical protein
VRASVDHLEPERHVGVLRGWLVSNLTELEDAVPEREDALLQLDDAVPDPEDALPRLEDLLPELGENGGAVDENEGELTVKSADGAMSASDVDASSIARAAIRVQVAGPEVKRGSPAGKPGTWGVAALSHVVERRW